MYRVNHWFAELEHKQSFKMRKKLRGRQRASPDHAAKVDFDSGSDEVDGFDSSDE